MARPPFNPPWAADEEYIKQQSKKQELGTFGKSFVFAHPQNSFQVVRERVNISAINLSLKPGSVPRVAELQQTCVLF